MTTVKNAIFVASIASLLFGCADSSVGDLTPIESALLSGCVGNVATSGSAGGGVSDSIVAIQAFGGSNLVITTYSSATGQFTSSNFELGTGITAVGSWGDPTSIGSLDTVSSVAAGSVINFQGSGASPAHGLGSVTLTGAFTSRQYFHLSALNKVSASWIGGLQFDGPNGAAVIQLFNDCGAVASTTGVGEVTTFSATSPGAAYVDFQVDGHFIGRASSAPFSVNWGQLTVGTHTLVAYPADEAGHFTVSAPVSFNVTTTCVSTTPVKIIGLACSCQNQARTFSRSPFSASTYLCRAPITP